MLIASLPAGQRHAGYRHQRRWLHRGINVHSRRMSGRNANRHVAENARDRRLQSPRRSTIMPGKPAGSAHQAAHC
ncbi:hypothetical protein KCP74_15505 [Salmonella enterica subsp. enterica]|nr:hypothetical protein KCP74_15505 [Salmonella enterica subsp. enterica]